MAKVAIIGAGISGISVAKMLQEKHHKVKVFEKADKIGGLIKCERINGNLFHKVGGHVFNTKNKEVADWFWKNFDKNNEFIQAKRNAKIYLNNQYIGYPLENYLYQLTPELIKSIVSDLTGIASEKQPHFLNFAEFLKGNFGKTLYEIYFQPYNKKIWNTNLNNVPLEWLDGKLPMPNINEILTNNIIKAEETDMVHSTFFYAKEGGSQFIIDRLAQNIEVVTGYNLQSIRMIKDQLVLNELESFNYVIFTGDVRQLNNIITTEDPNLNEDLHSVKDLKSNGTSNLFCETDKTDLSWLYLPEQHLKAHRIIYTGNFSPNNNSVAGRKTCVVEFSGECNFNVMREEVKSLPGNLKPISFNFEPNSYVIQDENTRQKIASLKASLKKNNTFLLGRFAEWEYYNMDKAIEAALKLTEQL